GLKGALRHHLEATTRNGRADGGERDKIRWVFGPDGGGRDGAGEAEGEPSQRETRPSDHAGAVAFGDGRLLLFPVRSLAGTFAYCTSAVAVARLCRDLELAGASVAWQAPATPPDGKALVPPGTALAIDRKIVVEDFDLDAVEDPSAAALAAWLGDHSLPATQGFDHFRGRIKTHLAVLPDELFAHVTRLGTVVEPHVKIDDSTGTAAGTAFFYAEHLPPDSLLWSLVGVGRPRGRRDDAGELERLGLSGAAGIEAYLRSALSGRAVQVGAEATTGRGLVHVRFTGETGR
ncbi:MAG: type III-B CRISPR module RAMP protein Cmr4, partial [Candidatus Rokuibacteriota bacterium]